MIPSPIFFCAGIFHDTVEIHTLAPSMYPFQFRYYVATMLHPFFDTVDKIVAREH